MLALVFPSYLCSSILFLRFSLSYMSLILSHVYTLWNLSSFEDPLCCSMRLVKQPCPFKKILIGIICYYIVKILFLKVSKVSWVILSFKIEDHGITVLFSPSYSNKHTTPHIHTHFAKIQMPLCLLDCPNRTCITWLVFWSFSNSVCKQLSFADEMVLVLLLFKKYLQVLCEVGEKEFQLVHFHY